MTADEIKAASNVGALELAWMIDRYWAFAGGFVASAVFMFGIQRLVIPRAEVTADHIMGCAKNGDLLIHGIDFDFAGGGYVGLHCPNGLSYRVDANGFHDRSAHPGAENPI